MNKKIIFGIVFIALVIILGLFLKDIKPELNTQEVSEYDPLDVTLDFYDEWLAAIKSTSTNPYQSELFKEPLLSSSLRTKLSEMPAEGTIDPVLCQDPIPEKIRSKILYELPEEVKIFIFSKEQGTAGQAVVTLRYLNEGWYIDDISCSKEFEEPGEFTFEHAGNLLKDSIPSPYNSDHWHLIYTQDGIPGYVVPIFFDAESSCIDIDNNETVCDTNQFTETQEVMLRGNMTEAGVEVKKLEYLNN